MVSAHLNLMCAASRPLTFIFTSQRSIPWRFRYPLRKKRAAYYGAELTIATIILRLR